MTIGLGESVTDEARPSGSYSYSYMSTFILADRAIDRPEKIVPEYGLQAMELVKRPALKDSVGYHTYLCVHFIDEAAIKVPIPVGGGAATSPPIRLAYR